MAVRIVLDFDGVLFNSAFEAYTVANAAVRGRLGYRSDVSFEEFLDFRAVVTDAWHYNRLYCPALKRSVATLPGTAPDDADWQFAKRFFHARAELMRDADWPKLMAPYDFFHQLKPLLLAQRERFAILSTRNVASIRQTLAFFGADVVDVFGQEDLRRAGSKLAVAREQGWLDRGAGMIVYVDDMNAHLEPFEGQVHLPLHADWGYDRSHSGSLSQHQVLKIIGSMLMLAAPARQAVAAAA